MMMAAVAAAVLTSCSNSELIELSDSRAIGFETYVGKASTRGVPVTGNKFADGQSIKVWGFYTDSQMTGTTYDATATGIPNLEGAVITKTGGNWTYSPQAYWKTVKPIHSLQAHREKLPLHWHPEYFRTQYRMRLPTR